MSLKLHQLKSNAYWVIGAIMIVMSFFPCLYWNLSKSLVIVLLIQYFIKYWNIFEIIAFLYCSLFVNRFDYKTLFYVASLVTGFRLVFFDMFVENFCNFRITQSFYNFYFGFFYAFYEYIENVYKNQYKIKHYKFLMITLIGVLKSLFIFVFAYLLYHGVF